MAIILAHFSYYIDPTVSDPVIGIFADSIGDSDCQTEGSLTISGVMSLTVAQKGVYHHDGHGAFFVRVFVSAKAAFSKPDETPLVTLPLNHLPLFLPLSEDEAATVCLMGSETLNKTHLRLKEHTRTEEPLTLTAIKKED